MMPSDSIDLIANPHFPRSIAGAQHANSVPSTPYQKARDAQSPSRSPSPRQVNGTSSPQSIASDAVGRPNNRYVVPVMCRFESGAEIKRRRIPYKDDGNQELAPPAIEPKTALDPEEEDKLNGDMRELYDRLLPSEESETRRAQLIQKLDRILTEEWPDGDIRVNVFGSSGNLLSSNDSDVDICITTSKKSLESMHSIAHLLNKHGMQKVICRASAKVPIVKCWDPELSLSADMNVNNPLALENTRMIKTYVQMDSRVRPLAKIIKHWTKQRCLNDASFGGTISSYTWICMILNFLQRRKVPILPSLQKIKGKRKSTDPEVESKFADDLDELKGFGDSNTETQAQLLFQFFRHYGYEFDYSKYVVSVREGRPVTREEKGWHPSNYQEKEARNRLCVEEPFTVVRNLGNSADDYAWSGIHTEIRRAFDLIAAGKLSEACEEYVFPPEEKTIFQRPVAKAPVTLRRSASQTSRANPENTQGRSRKNNRNQSAQRAGNRRASSGAAFNNARLPPNGYPISPMAAVGSLDLFSPKNNLHDQLFQQYQLLQAQEDVLRSELAAREQAHAQTRNKADGIHPQRVANSIITGSKVLEAPRTAPLLSGPFYPFPQNIGRPPQIGHQVMRDGTVTNPSSPSLKNSMPIYRRSVVRTHAMEESPVSTRSQSQPGRALPRPLNLQQTVHPIYDMATGMPLPPQFGSMYAHGQGQIGYSVSSPFSPMLPLQTSDVHLPKEYLGYTMGPSPQLLPQNMHQAQYSFGPPGIIPMTLRGPSGSRPRRFTPEHGLGLSTSKAASRSPSPFDKSGRDITNKDIHSNIATGGMQSPTTSESIASLTSGTAPTEPDIAAPVIVNGSNVPFEATWELIPGTAEDDSTVTVDDLSKNLETFSLQKVPPKGSFGSTSQQQPITTNGVVLPTGSLSAEKVKSDIEALKKSPDHMPTIVHTPLMTPVHAPLLSPVAELRTPSPKFVRPVDLINGGLRNGLTAGPPLLNGLHKEDVKEVLVARPSLEQNHLRQGSIPNIVGLTQDKPKNTPVARDFPSNDNENANPNNPNPWQQATRKGHKKAKSLGSARVFNGQTLLSNLGERKGG